ncbi:galactitol-1-phosphate 5-dehydrogenase [Litorilinea aerophila]|uniref:Galactitol-1-phosphate 5-dehydrogenase n=1 Tax=Litorilinea aerophila TaxID=1204385 RepID=A0A540VIW2_9CHLR|nr:galactitol-1-phosphate 5-dehydrogenase [Litorilinea aerophila]MCC9075897.1 galactitol-1-phosphate 5-dehydrogenase [Litorilinea aerophila]OUC09620.1 theronine dehydrogenase [Litorilinea aerophila]GIV77172.1 MAG: galactitol-1-phosphate 5-dehydrogenase [Litorilinea sp.]
MKALVYQGPMTMTLEEVPAPTVGDDDILIQVRSVGICGSDVHGYIGKTGRRKPPMIMGHEFSGQVVAVGKAVQRVAPGDAVIVSPIQACGHCPNCQAGLTNICTNRHVLGVDIAGAYADQLVVKESMVYPKPAGMSWRHAAMVEPLSVAMHAVEITPIPLMGTVAIVGAGTIGLLTLLAARLKGAGTVIVTDKSPHRLEMAEELGADLAIHVDQQDPVAAVREATDGLGADVAFEAVGYAPTVQQALAITRTGGHVTWIGNSAQMIELNMQEVVTRELTVRGTYGFNKEFPRAIQAIASGRVNVEPLIERVAPLAEGPQIIHDLATGRSDLIKVILEP